jgi:hypothetical protein
MRNRVVKLVYFLWNDISIIYIQRKVWRYQRGNQLRAKSDCVYYFSTSWIIPLPQHNNIYRYTNYGLGGRVVKLAYFWSQAGYHLRFYALWYLSPVLMILDIYSRTGFRSSGKWTCMCVLGVDFSNASAIFRLELFWLCGIVLDGYRSIRYKLTERTLMPSSLVDWKAAKSENKYNWLYRLKLKDLEA